MELLDMEPEGPADQPWLRALDPTYVDTSEYAARVRGRSASRRQELQPWRVVIQRDGSGSWLHENIENFIVTDAEQRREADQRHLGPAGGR